MAKPGCEFWSDVWLFGLDGTLVDRLPSLERFLPEQYQRYGGSQPALADAFVRRFLGLEQNGHTPKAEVYKTLTREFELNASVAELVTDFRLNAFKTCTAQPGALEMLGHLRLQGAIGIVTNGSVTTQTQKLEALGLDGLVDFSLISETVRVRKPEPEIFLEAVRRFGAELSACLFVGNHPEKDIVGARAVGMRTGWLRHGRVWPQHLSPPTFAVSGLEDLLILYS